MVLFREDHAFKARRSVNAGQVGTSDDQNQWFRGVAKLRQRDICRFMILERLGYYSKLLPGKKRWKYHHFK